MSEDKRIKGIVSDAAKAGIETGTEVVLDNLPAIANEAGKIIGNSAVNAVIQSIAGGVIGAIAPGVFSLGLAYKQNRLERNVVSFLQQIATRQDMIETRLNALDEETRQKFVNGSYRDALLDNIVSENQEQKVQDNINGYINMMSVENPNDVIVFTFFTTLSQMNELDIRVLKIYTPRFLDEAPTEDFMTIMKSAGISQQQYNFIREKLARFGMIESKNEEKRDRNLEVLGDKVTELIKQLYAKKPKEVKPPKLEKVRLTDSYSITSLGRNFLQFIAEPVDSENGRQE